MPAQYPREPKIKITQSIKTMVGKALWALLVVLAILIGLYPGIYFLIDREFGLLASKSDELLADLFWNAGFYSHIVPGGIALLLGWMQFSPRLRATRPALHRQVGKVYVGAVLVSSLAGVYIGFYATGGLAASLGFICLGVIWFYTTLKAYLHIRHKAIEPHRTMMIYSYAACFAAVTLRVWLPMLQVIFGDFYTAYRLVAWLCWVPNLAVAGWIVWRSKAQKALA